MADLIEQLRIQGRTFDFFQAVMLLEEYYAGKGVSDPVRAGLVRFAADAGVSFPACDISEVEADESGVRFLLTFMGLFGVSSPLPHYFSEYIAQHEDNESLSDFLSIFNHRVYSLFYRSWKKYRSLLNQAHMATVIARLAGLGPESANGDRTLLAYTGLLAGRRSAPALEAMISHRYGGVPVTVHQWIPRWAPVANPARLGDDASLGINTMIGTHIFDVAGKFRVTLGPLPRERFEQFTPGAADLKDLRRTVAAFISDPLEFDIEVQLQALDLIPVTLGAREGRLGVTASLGRGGTTGAAHSIVIE
jgi:type VI secretion system protein ImpH